MPADPKQDVLDQLEGDFTPKSTEWVKSAKWSGPKSIPLDQIDYSKSSTWRAAHEPDKVKRFVKHIARGRMKPIILFQRPGSPLYEVSDGHHRAMAYRKSGTPAMAYVAIVDAAGAKAADEMHSSQKSETSRFTMASMLDAFWLDLGAADVHVPGSPGPKKAMPKAKKLDPKKRRTTRVYARLGAGGSLSVRHMFDGAETAVELGGLFELDAAADGPVWNQIACTGSFKGHHQGEFAITPAVLSDILRNFKATKNRQVPLDFEHASEQDPAKLAEGGAPAPGFIVDMQLRGEDQLWGLFDWNVKGRDVVRAKEYRFFSPAIRFNAKDRVTGDRIGAFMSSGALTNKPFLDGMAPLAASHTTAPTAALCFSSNEFLPKLRTVLKLHDLATPFECSEHADKLSDLFDEADGDHEATVSGVRLADYAKPLRDLVGARPGMTWDDVFGIVDEHLSEAIHASDAGEEDDDDTEPPESGALLNDPDPPAGETTMSMTPEEKTILATAQTEATTLTSKVNELSLTLKAETAARETAEAALKVLTDKVKGIELSAQTAEVDAAIKLHGAKKGIAADMAPALLSFLQTSPDAFRKLYPPSDPSRPAFLFTEVTPPVKKDDPNSVVSEINNESIGATINRLMSQDPKLSYEKACDKAYEMRGNGR